MLVAVLVIGGLVYLWIDSSRPQESPDTPIIVIDIERSATGDYNLTVLAVTSNSVRWVEIRLEIDPTGGYTSTMPSANYVRANDTIGIANLTPGTMYTITLRYLINDCVCFQTILKAT